MQQRTTRKPNRWSAEEDAKLTVAVAKHGAKKWKSIAATIPGRDDSQCMQRWNKSLIPTIVKGKWSKVEDALLVHLVNSSSSGEKDWAQIATKIPGRTSKQIRQRWAVQLDPMLNHGPFTTEEDEILLKRFAQFGNSWARIATALPGRSSNAVKVQLKSLQRKRKRQPKHRDASASSEDHSLSRKRKIENMKREALFQDVLGEEETEVFLEGVMGQEMFEQEPTENFLHEVDLMLDQMRESEILTATTTTESPKAIERHSESGVNSLMAIHRQPCATASEVSLIDLSTAQAHLILSYVHHQHSTSSDLRHTHLHPGTVLDEDVPMHGSGLLRYDPSIEHAAQCLRVVRQSTNSSFGTGTFVANGGLQPMCVLEGWAFCMLALVQQRHVQGKSIALQNAHTAVTIAHAMHEPRLLGWSYLSYAGALMMQGTKAAVQEAKAHARTALTLYDAGGEPCWRLMGWADYVLAQCHMLQGHFHLQSAQVLLNDNADDIDNGEFFPGLNGGIHALNAAFEASVDARKARHSFHNAIHFATRSRKLALIGKKLKFPTAIKLAARLQQLVLACKAGIKACEKHTIDSEIAQGFNPSTRATAAATVAAAVATGAAINALASALSSCNYARGISNGSDTGTAKCIGSPLPRVSTGTHCEAGPYTYKECTGMYQQRDVRSEQWNVPSGPSHQFTQAIFAAEIPSHQFTQAKFLRAMKELRIDLTSEADETGDITSERVVAGAVVDGASDITQQDILASARCLTTDKNVADRLQQLIKGATDNNMDADAVAAVGVDIPSPFISGGRVGGRGNAKDDDVSAVNELLDEADAIDSAVDSQEWCCHRDSIMSLGRDRDSISSILSVLGDDSDVTLPLVDPKRG